jgi:outer membrane protein
MSRSFAIVAVLASAVVVSAAQTTSTAKARVVPPKVAVISFQMAVFQTNQFRREFDALKTKFAPKNEQVKTLNDEIAGLEKQLQAEADKLSDQERASRAQAIERKKSEAKRFTEDAQKDFEQEVQQIYSGVASKLNDVLSVYAKKQGYTMVVGVVHNPQQASPVLWTNPSADITQVIVDAYNAKPDAPVSPARPAAKPVKPQAKSRAAH